MPELGIALLIIPLLAWLADTGRHLVRLLHILQLEEYETDRYLRWLAADPFKSIQLPRLIAALVAIVVAVVIHVLGGPILIVAALWGIVGLALAITNRRPPAKKPLKFTARASATMVTAGAIAVALVAVGALVLRPRGALVGIAGVIVGASLADLLAGPILALANLVFSPAQFLARERIIRQARAKLAAQNVTVVGITGSYGKTSTKEILAALLGAKYKVLKTPESYNTPLGIARVILRDLEPDHEVFVVEMGAYYPGDIGRLCRIARPKVGILTAVNAQHLERMGSVENTARTKYELIQSLPADGTAIFNVDNEWCRRLADQTTTRTLRYGLQPSPDLDLTANDVHTTRWGVAFTMNVAAGALAKLSGHAGTTETKCVQIEAGLLGRHNAGNILGAAAAALACGMTPEEITRAAARIEPVPHRLEIISGERGVTVIDDSYNANPDGVAAALDVLREFPGKKKVLVTPGMVELGSSEAEENRRFGRAAAAVCDAVILVGPKRTAPIQAGLAEAGYPAEKTFVVASVAEATTRLGTLLAPGDVVLFSNDLPDTYEEAS